MIVQSRNVWLNEKLIPAQIVIDSGIITSINEYDSVSPDVDYGDLMILPGLIDAHTHGNNGVSSTTSSLEEIKRWQKEIVKEGVTSFAVTTATESVVDNLSAFNRLSQAVGKSVGAEIVGIYMEGNFINPLKKGAHDETLIEKPTIDRLQEYLDASNHKISRMILAVELDSNYEVLQYALSKGVKVSIGHSACSYQQAKEAINLGADAITHTFNAMNPFLHRETGLVGAAFDFDQVYAEIIADGHHVSWPAVRSLCKMKDDNHLVLVTDASPLKGYLGELPPEIHIDEEGQFRLANGALCSSSLRMNDGVKNLIKFGETTLKKAINSATINPARMLGVANRKGSLEKGKDADIIVCAEDFSIIECYCSGISMINQNESKS